MEDADGRHVKTIELNIFLRLVSSGEQRRFKK